ncbi:SOS response-associated peptidase [Yoonia sp. F2084L]|nr:SOS response-associated peptidase [Yoonia sp. F2084L]MCK0095229.1 SOS response-associated peptidase [Yoonia sp. F2084L]
MPGRFFLTETIEGFTDPPRLNIAPGQDVITLTTERPRHMR